MAQLLYDVERINSMLVYDYSDHLWIQNDNRYLVNEQWCADRDGVVVVGALRKNDSALIAKYAEVIATHERENLKWANFSNCRRRKCICKACDKRCFCDNCRGNILGCNKHRRDHALY